MKLNSEDGNHAVFFFRTSLIFLLTMMACNQAEKENKKESLSSSSVENILIRQKDSILIANAKKKKLYLTFDDGPNKGTPHVISVLKEENVPASFFIVGEHVYKSPGQHESWTKLHTLQNIELCNHSFTHALHNHFQRFYSKPSRVIRDFQRTEDSLHLNSNIIRMPGRNCWRIDSVNFTDIKKNKPTIDSLQKAGYRIIGWDLEWHYDPKTVKVIGTADEMVKKIDTMFTYGKTLKKDNMVLLMHDQTFQSDEDYQQLKEFIQKLKQKNEYELLLVKDYPRSVKTN